MAVPTVDELEQRAQRAEQSRVPLFLKVGRAVVWAVYAIVVVVVAVLLLAFVLRLLGASTDAAFTRWVYRNADSAMRPFRGIFPTRELGDVSVLDVSLLFGAVVYAIVAMALDAAVSWFEVALSRRRHATQVARSRADQVRFEAESQLAAAEISARWAATDPSNRTPPAR